MTPRKGNMRMHALIVQNKTKHTCLWGGGGEGYSNETRKANKTERAARRLKHPQQPRITLKKYTTSK